MKKGAVSPRRRSSHSRACHSLCTRAAPVVHGCRDAPLERQQTGRGHGKRGWARTVSAHGRDERVRLGACKHRGATHC
eukprot:6197672-Pleurochrysis_carterae.AAC.1